ncbi:MAG: hypothetical protein OQK82_07940, partial [Candidatus Pacearchaeota archaeon]|nr:hypothetical protein [Candidatus Pacearchaeota archaeon]
MESLRKRRKVVKKNIEPRLIRRLKIFAIIITIILIIEIYKVLLGKTNISLVIFGFLIGITIGLIMGKISKIIWDSKTEKVVSRLDKIGMIFLILYICVAIGKRWLFGHWLHGTDLSTFTLTFLAGVFLGRFLMIIKRIKQVLRK